MTAYREQQKKALYSLAMFSGNGAAYAIGCVRICLSVRNVGVL